MCPSGLGWVSQASKSETLHFLSVNHVRKRREAGMAWQLPQCAKQNRAERTDRRLNVTPILLEKDPFEAQTSQGPCLRLTFFSCSARERSTSLTLNGLPCQCLGSVYLPSKRISWGETGMGAVNNIVAGSVLVSHKYILPNFTTSLPTEVSFIWQWGNWSWGRWDLAPSHMMRQSRLARVPQHWLALYGENLSLKL